MSRALRVGSSGRRMPCKGSCSRNPRSSERLDFRSEIKKNFLSAHKSSCKIYGVFLPPWTFWEGQKEAGNGLCSVLVRYVEECLLLTVRFMSFTVWVTYSGSQLSWQESLLSYILPVPLTQSFLQSQSTKVFNVKIWGQVLSVCVCVCQDYEQMNK